jgi:nucleoside-diphosphate-sugar epimerase
MERGVERFVYVSSAHVYKSSDLPVNEEGLLEPGSEYATQKLEAEERLRELTKSSPLELISLRLFSVLSLDGTPETLGARVARALESNTPLVIPFAADRRDFLSPMAYANLILQIATSDSVKHKIINVGSGNALSVEDAVRRLLTSNRQLDLAIEFETKFSAIPNLVADNQRLRQTLGAQAGSLAFP